MGSVNSSEYKVKTSSTPSSPAPCSLNVSEEKEQRPLVSSGLPLNGVPKNGALAPEGRASRFATAGEGEGGSPALRGEGTLGLKGTVRCSGINETGDRKGYQCLRYIYPIKGNEIDGKHYCSDHYNKAFKDKQVKIRDKPLEVFSGNKSENVADYEINTGWSIFKLFSTRTYDNRNRKSMTISSSRTGYSEISTKSVFTIEYK